MVGRLLCVFALLALVLWVLKRTGGFGARRRGTPLQVLSTTRLGKTALLSVVRVHDEEYVLGITGHAVTVVSSRPAPAQPVVADASPPGSATLADVGASAGPDAAPVAYARLDELQTETAARPAGPPSTARFLRDGWEVLRKRPVEATAVSTAAVAAALAHARGEDAPPLPRHGDAPPAPRHEDARPASGHRDTLAEPSFADGPADDQAGMDAGPGEGLDLWSRTDVAV